MQINYQNDVPLFPARGVAIIDAFLAIASWAAMANGTDAERQGLTRAIVEQLVFEDPAAGFVTKSASPTRPQSKDAIGFLSGGVLFCWDWQNGSNRQRQVQADAPAERIADQNPIPVGPVNHLGAPVSPQAPQPPAQPPVPPLADNREISEKLDRVVDLLGSVVGVIAQMAGAVDGIARTQQEQGIVMGNTAANVAEALTIARTIHETTTHQAGEAERASTNIHETAVRVGEVVSDLGPLLNLLAALKGGKAPKK